MIGAGADAELQPPAAEVARLANLKGDPDRAWTRISEEAPDAYRSPAGRVSTLVAAGEVQLERKELRQSAAYFEQALKVEPDNFDAHVGYAKLLAAQSRPADARRLLDRAAEIDRESALPLELAADLSKEQPGDKAELLLQAASRRAATSTWANSSGCPATPARECSR